MENKWLRYIRIALTFLALGGYILFDYSFTNLSLRFRNIPIPVGYLLTYLALLELLIEKKRQVLSMLRQPQNIFLTFLARLGLIDFHIFSYVLITIALLFHRSLLIETHGSNDHRITLWLAAFFN